MLTDPITLNQTPQIAFPTDQPVLLHEPARPGPTDSAEPEEEKWAIHLLLLLKATDSAHVMSDDDNDSDSDSELESTGDSNDQSESEVEEYPRLRSSMAIDGEEEADNEEVSDVDARSPANIKNESDASKSESESEDEDSNSMMDQEEDGDNDEDEDVDQPEEEDFSEGDEYVDPSSASSSSRRNRSHARRQSSMPSSPASAPMTPHHHSTASASVIYAGQPEAHSSPSSYGLVPVSATAAHSPLSSSTASAAPASSKKTRKPKYSAALEARWEEKFEWLLTYKRVKGNCRVAEGNKEYPGLGKWLSNQKTLCKKGKLKAERRQKLIDVGAIADPGLRSGSSSSAAARAGAMSMMTSSSPPSSPSSSASPRLGADHPGIEGDDDAQGPLTKRRRKGHDLVVNIERIPSMSSDQEVDSAVSSPSTTPATAGGLFSASSPFRTFQGKPILPSLSFPHPMAPGGLHPYLPPQQPTPQQQQSAGNGSFLSFALTAMPPTVLFPSYSIH